MSNSITEEQYQTYAKAVLNLMRQNKDKYPFMAQLVKLAYMNGTSKQLGILVGALLLTHLKMGVSIEDSAEDIEKANAEGFVDAIFG